MNLEQLQREMFEVIRQPLAADDRTPELTLDGKSTREIAERIIKPNDRMTSVERLQIYNQVYWYRILSSLAEDYPGLRAIIGQESFDRVLIAYLTERPSQSFTLRNLGSRLEQWLSEHPEFAGRNQRIALDMVRLEWADIDVFDSEERPAISEKDLAALGEDPVFHLQPYLRLLELSYPVDELLLKIRHEEKTDENESDVASNVVMMESTHQKETKRRSLPRAKKVYLAVHRQDNDMYFKRLQPEAFALLRALQQGKTLSEAIAESVNWTRRKVEFITVRVHDWFANWSSLGWFCRPPENDSRP